MSHAADLLLFAVLVFALAPFVVLAVVLVVVSRRDRRADARQQQTRQ